MEKIHLDAGRSKSRSFRADHSEFYPKLKDFTRFAQLINDAVIIADNRRRIIFLNRAAERLLGYRSHEVAGKDLHRTIIPASRGTAHNPALWQYMQTAKSKHIDRSIETKIRRKDGELVPVELTVSGIMINGVRSSIGILRDISRRKQAEKMLRESEEKFRNLAEKSPNMIFINQHGRVVYANARCEEIMGYKRAEFYAPGFDFRTLIAPEYAGIVEKNYRMHLRDKERKPFEYALLTKDGRRIEALFTTRLINYGGNPAILGIITDITDRKQAERELRESKTLLEKIFASMDEAVGIVDFKTRNTIMCNQAVERILGYKVEEVIGRNTKFLYANSKDYRDFGKKYGDPEGLENAVRSRRKTTTVQFQIRRKDGRVIPTEHTISLIADESRHRIIGVNVMRDITLRKQVEDQSREYQEKLRTLATELSQTEERERRRLAKDLHDHIGQNLAVTRIKMGELREKIRDLDGLRTLDRARKLIETSIRSIRTLTFELSPPLLYEVGLEAAIEWLAEQTKEQSNIDVRVRIKGRSGHLDDDMRIFLYNTVRELLLNVVKHSRARCAIVKLTYSRGRIAVSVQDNGIGIKPARIGSQHDLAAGFGLFSIRERVNNYGGGMKIAGRSGSGIAISIWIPIHPRRGR